MFKRWFKPKWLHTDPEVRRLAIVSLKPDNAEHRGVLEQMVLQDENQQVRLAAADRLSDLSTVNKAFKCAQEQEERLALAKLLIDLLVKDSNLLDNGFEALLDDVTTTEIFRPYISEAYPERFVSYLLSRVTDDQEFFAQLAQHYPSSKVRLAASERLTDPDALKTVQDNAKGRDKAVFRQTKNALSAMKDTLKAQADQREQAERLLQEMARLAGAQPDVLLPHKLKQLAQEWQALSIDNPDFHSQFNTLHQQVEEKSQQITQEKDRQAAAVKNQAQAIASFSEVCASLSEGFDLLAAEESIQDIDLESLGKIQRLQSEKWAQASSHAEPSGELSARFNKLNQDIDIYIETVGRIQEHYKDIVPTFEQIVEAKPTEQKHLSDLCDRLSWFAGSAQWPAGVKKPSFLLTLESSLSQARHKLLASSKALSEVEKKLQRQLKQLKALIEEGLLKEGQAALRECHALQKELPMRVGERYQKELRLLMQSLNELRDWQGFATIPKKEQLLEQMQTLAQTDCEDPQTRANQVKLFQQQWKELGVGGSKEEKSLWEAFKQVADEAYAPCRPYFDAQQQLREQNLSNREQIIAHLETYLNENDWGNADWAMVVKTLKVAREQWRASTPVERRHHARTQKKFESLVKKLQALIDAERDKNLQIKAQIVAEAEALLDYDELDQAIESMKALQSRWKAVGMVKKESDHDLWQQFRQHADVLFAQRHQHREALEQQREDNLNQAMQSIQQVEKILQFDSTSILTEQDRVKQLQQDFEQIAPLPKAKAAQLRSTFRELIKRFGLAVTQAQSIESAQACKRLAAASSLLDQYDRQLTLEGAQHVDLQQLKQDWQELGALPEAAQAAMNARFDRAVLAVNAHQNPSDARPTAKLQQQIQSLHETVLLLEITLGLDSPSDDQAQRMSLQVGRLSDKLAGKINQKDVDRSVLDAILIWAQMEKVGLFPEIEPYLSRFQKAVSTWYDKSVSSNLKETNTKKHADRGVTA